MDYYGKCLICKKTFNKDDWKAEKYMWDVLNEGGVMTEDQNEELWEKLIEYAEHLASKSKDPSGNGLCMRCAEWAITDMANAVWKSLPSE